MTENLVEFLIQSEADPPILLASRDEIERRDTTRLLHIFLEMMRPEYARALRQRVWLGVDGYDHDQRELIEIPQVREWMRRLDQSWPYSFFFLEPKNSTSLHLLACSVCAFEFAGGIQQRSIGDLSPRPVRAVQFTNQLELAAFLEAHFGAMNAICEGLGDPESTIKEMSERIFRAFGFNTADSDLGE